MPEAQASGTIRLEIDHNDMAEAKDKILHVPQIARFFGVAEKTVWEWCKSGKLPAFKIGKEWRVRKSDLQKMINQKVKSSRTQKALF